MTVRFLIAKMTGPHESAIIYAEKIASRIKDKDITFTVELGFNESMIYMESESYCQCNTENRFEALSNAITHLREQGFIPDKSWE